MIKFICETTLNPILFQGISWDEKGFSSATLAEEQRTGWRNLLKGLQSEAEKLLPAVGTHAVSCMSRVAHRKPRASSRAPQVRRLESRTSSLVWPKSRVAGRVQGLVFGVALLESRGTILESCAASNATLVTCLESHLQ